MVDFTPRKKPINATAYSETLKKLRHAFRNKRRGLLSDGINLLSDNAGQHTARVTQNLIQSFRWQDLLSS